MDWHPLRHDQPAPHLDLWLATNSDLGFGKLAVSTAARELGLADPALRWSGSTLYYGSTLAYLTVRPIDDDTDELGFVTHGPGSDELADQVNDLLHRWSQNRPPQPTVTAYPAHAPDDQLGAGTRVTRPETRLTISW